MSSSACYRAAEKLVRSVGVSYTIEGLRHFTYGLELLHYNDTLLNDMRHFDELIAEHYQKPKPSTVEHSLRLARDAIMNDGDEARIREIMGRPMRRWPSVATLLDGFAYYMEAEGLWPE